MHSDPREGFRRKERPASTSQMLRDFADTLDGERVSLEEIIGALGDRGLGVLIAVFAAPNILPSTILFGNVVAGLPVIFLAVHLMLGAQHLALPRILAKRTIGAKLLKAFVPRLAAIMARIEKLLRPRLLEVIGPGGEKIIGVLCLLLSIVSSLPIPFGHNLPALGLTLIGLGLIEHDGLAIVLGAAAGIIGVAAVALVLFGLASGLRYLPL
ncbi:MAG TPA: exopolysaccharide biosynthesis protein [Rhizomicrobium sp.]|jgi:hypothetical protein|nr:exopolysaccharide biosynthesis protein [Rhizomicrobium sp.]